MCYDLCWMVALVGGGLCCYLIVHISMLDLMLRNPLLPLLAVSRRKSDVLQFDR